MPTYKVVINVCYGEFGLSDTAVSRLAELGLKDVDEYNLCRHDPRLVQVVEELGERASANYAELVVKEIDYHKYIINDSEGSESVANFDSIIWSDARVCE